MRFKTITLFSLLCCSFLLQAQTYDISQYRARFERRPFLEINPSFFYSGLFTDQNNSDRHAGGASLLVNWREQSNLDDRILSFSISGQAQFNRQELESSGLVDQSQKGASLFAGVSRYDYYKENKFWGIRGSASVSAQDRDNEFQVSDRSTNIAVRPGVFFGTGRIEFSEDAILANWMMDDLVENGVVSTVTPEQREALARRITSIIGNRTFDFRRRRIYELQQLKNLFTEEGITNTDDFMLFAILNDNWAFVTPPALPHGKRLQYGVDAGVSYNYRSMPIANDYSILEGTPYVNFTSAKIKNNNASAQWGVQVEASYVDYLDNEGANFLFIENSYGAGVRLNYEYIWLPISRTSLRWQNQVSARWAANTFLGNPETQNVRQYDINTGLQWDYFVAYNWRFVLNVGINGSFNDQEFFGSKAISPFINFSTRYAIF